MWTEAGLEGKARGQEMQRNLWKQPRRAVVADEERHEGPGMAISGVKGTELSLRSAVGRGKTTDGERRQRRDQGDLLHWRHPNRASSWPSAQPPGSHLARGQTHHSSPHPWQETKEFPGHLWVLTLTEQAEMHVSFGLFWKPCLRVSCGQPLGPKPVPS